jgi:hypothetical protein
MSNALRGLLLSHALFVLSGVSYSVYWVQQAYARGPSMVLFFFLSLVSGVVAATAAFFCVLAGAMDGAGGGPRQGHVVAACAAILAIAYVVTGPVMGRPFTSELVFVMIWATAEYCALLAAYRNRWLPARGAIAATVLVSIALATGLACYAVYFVLEGAARFWAGLVPYGVVAIAMLAVGAMLLRAVPDARFLQKGPDLG